MQSRHAAKLRRLGFWECFEDLNGPMDMVFVRLGEEESSEASTVVVDETGLLWLAEGHIDLEPDGFEDLMAPT